MLQNRYYYSVLKVSKLGPGEVRRITKPELHPKHMGEFIFRPQAASLKSAAPSSRLMLLLTFSKNNI